MIQENLQINIGANTQDLQTGLNQATASVNTFSASVQRAVKPTGDATQSLTNLGRIAQDAPYGFMGIANNLNPMLESFQRLQKEAGGSVGALKAMAAGLSGPAGIGVALSVGSSLLIAFGSKIDEFYTKLQLGSTITLQYATALKSIGGDFTGAADKVNKVEIAFNEYHKGVLTGTEALKIYNDTLGKNLGIKSTINEAEQAFAEKTKVYVEASFQRALADQASKKAAEELLKVKILQATGGEKTGEFGKMLTAEAAKALVSPLLQKPLTDKLVNLYDKDKTEKDIAKGFDLIANYKKIAEEARTLSDQLSKSGGINLEPEKATKTGTTGTKGGAIKKEVDDYGTEVLNEMKRARMFYTEFREFVKTLNNGEIIKLETPDSLRKIEKKRLDSIKPLVDSVIKEMDEKGLGSILTKKAEQLSNIYKIEDAEAKERSKNLQKQEEQYKSMAETISKDLTGALMTMWDALEKGQNPLQALGNYLGELIKKFAAAIIQATIFKGIMSLLTTVSGGGGFFGSVLGGVSKLLGFAEGGIVSQPTIAMVGEGGQSEAIMPLNKLGNMMNSTFNAGAMSGTGGGGGNGQFVLKGNDLVLALQRSNYSLNLRRG